MSLAEMVLALGLIACVLISIAGLLVLGARQVHSGRKSSEALAVARAVLEEVQTWSFRQTYELFGHDGSATAYTIDSRSNAYASKWQRRLDHSFPEAHAEIDLRSRASGPAPALDSTKAIRVTVTVFWKEAGRARTFSVATVRM